MRRTLNDLRLALRVLAKSRTQTAVILLTLALGIGANAAIFSVVNGVLLEPLPFRHPERLVMVFERNLERGWKWFSVSHANFADWRRETEIFEELAAYSLYELTGFNLTGASEPERLASTGVTAGFFDVFGVDPQLGRTFAADENEPGKHRVVVLSYRFWQRRFGGDPGILEQRLQLDGEAYDVVGVMPSSFRFPATAEIWVPLPLAPEDLANRITRPLNTCGLLRGDVSLEQANEEMGALGRRLAQMHPRSNEGFDAIVFSLEERIVGNVRARIWAVFALVLLVLAIACSNVAGLLVARSAAREKEFALRMALGSGRRRIVRQLCAESLLLALAGGALGLLLAAWCTRLLVAAAPRYVPRLEEIGIDLPVLAFTMALSVVAGLLFGLVPALHISGSELYEILKEGGRSAVASRRGGLLRRALVVGQVAGTFVVLVAAVWMIRGLSSTLAVDPGFEPRGVLTAEVALVAEKSQEGTSPYAELFRESLERLHAMPGVEAAAVTTSVPFGSLPLSFDFHPEEAPPVSLADVPTAQCHAVSEGYFEVLGIPLREGRRFDGRDDGNGPCSVIVNESLAQRFLAPEGALGRRLRIGNLLRDALPGLPLSCEVVGVVGDVRQEDLNREAEATLYLPYRVYSRTPQVSRFFALRTRGAPRALAQGLRRQVQSLDRDLPVFNVRTLEQRLGGSISDARFTGTLLLAFAGVASFLAAVGIYGLLSFSVSQRVRELGVRLALGAQPAGIVRMVLREGLVLAAVGGTVGLVSALVLKTTLTQALFELFGSRVGADPLTFGAVAVFLLLAILAACSLPARRASRIDPMVALRDE